MDAITLLRDDHKTVESLFKRFEKAGARAYVDKRQIVDRIIEELSGHAAIEEQLFYPVARATVPDTETIALESLEEHHIVKWLLSELADLEPTHERFDAKVTVLIENVRHHVKEEEAEFFPIVRAHLSRSALADLGEALADAKKSAPTRPHPRASDVPPGNALIGAIAGAVDRVGDNLSGIAQGGVNAAQDLIARMVGKNTPKVSPTGSSVARRRASDVRRTAASVADGAQRTATTAKDGAVATAHAASSGAKATLNTAKKSARATAAAAKRTAPGTTGATPSSRRNAKPASAAKRPARAKAARGARS
jgi:hemerythrin-like domain-containing protein